MGTVKTITIRVVTDAQAKDLAKVQSVLKGITKERSALIAKQADNIELTKKETERLTELTVKQVKNRETQKKLTQSTKNLINSNNAAVGSYDKLVAETAILRNRLRQLPNAFDKSNVAARRLKDQISGNTDKLKKFDAEIGQNQRNVGNYAGALKGAVAGFGKLAVGIAAGVAALRVLQRVFGSVAGIVTDFQQGNAQLAAVLGKTRDQIKSLTIDQKRLGSTTAFTATQVGELQTEFAKLGFNEQEILAATEATLALAAATGAELSEAAAIAGATLGGFGLEADETQRVVDVMAKSFSISALDITKFQESMKTAAPAARAVGVSVEETTALLGTLANAGISGSRAGNALKGTFIELNKAGLTLEEGLAKVSGSQDKLGTATKLVGKIAATSFLVLAEGTETTERLEEGLNNAGGAAQRMADTQLDTLQGAVTILGSAFEGFILSLEDGEGVIGGIAKRVIELTTSFLSLLTATETQSDAIREQQAEFNVLVDTLKRGNLEEGNRVKLINQINEQFGDLLPNLISEKDSILAIAAAQRQANDRFREQIVLQATRERLQDTVSAQLDNTLEQLNLQIELTRRQAVVDDIAANAADGVNKSKSGVNLALAAAQKNLRETENAIKVNAKESDILAKEYDKVNEAATSMGVTLVNISSTVKTLTKDLEVQSDQTIETVEAITTSEIESSNTVLEIKTDNALQFAALDEKLKAKQLIRIAEQERKERENLQAFQSASSAAFSTIANFQQASLNRQLKAAEGNEEKQDEIRAKFGKKRKKAATIEAIINGAVAVTRILADVPKGDFGISTALLIAAAVVTTAGEVALIQSQEFAKGGLLTGSSHDQGGIPVSVGGSRVVEAEGGEAIINKRSTQMFTPLLSAINEAGGGVAFGKGGKLPMMAQEGTIVPEFADPKALQLESLLGGTGLLLQNQEKLVEFTTAINDRIDRIEVINVATDTASVANTAANIESRATFG